MTAEEFLESKENITVNDIFRLAESETDDGRVLFKFMVDELGKPLWDERYDSTMMDIEFFAKFGKMNASGFLENMVTTIGNQNPDADDYGTDPYFSNAKMAQMIYSKYKESWRRWLEVLNSQYVAYENYDRSQLNAITTTSQIDRTTDTTLTVGRVADTTGGDTLTKSGNQTTNNLQTKNLTDETQKKVNGFGSTVAQDESNEKVIQTGTDQNISTLTYNNVTDTGTNTQHIVDDTHNTGKEIGKDNKTETVTTTDRTHGNIGVTTTQQMLLSEIELFKWNCMNDIFRDVARELVSPIQPRRK